MKDFDDNPITDPAEDLFGFNPFAKTIAESICKLKDPKGSVIAINGQWGTGKSSIVNLIKHYIREQVPEEEITIIDFNCWWFRGEESLALEFFRQLYAATNIAQSEKAKEAISNLGSRMLSGSSSFIGAAINLFAVPGAGSATSEGMNLLGNLIKQERTVESYHKEISEELEASAKKVLIVIDDIDRLSPDEALLIFRLVKSIGRLPNVIYLMAYDKEIAERTVSETYPSEGPQYLEKIVQAGFDIPSPPHTRLMDIITDFLNRIWADLPDPDPRHFWNLMNDVVSPEIKSPRDALRVINALGFSWPAVNGEVDPTDFLCMETLRVLRPTLHTAIRQNKERLTDEMRNSLGMQMQSHADLYDTIFLGGAVGEERDRLKRALIRLFPPLASVWGNTHFCGGFVRDWAASRRACSSKHFDTYFSFALSDDNVSMQQVNAIIERCDEATFVQSTLLDAMNHPAGQSSTQAAVILEELNLHAKKIPIEKAAGFLAAIFAIYDQFHTDKDESRGFSFVSNRFRLHWVMRSVIRDRTSLEERSEIVMEAAVSASVGWLVELWLSAQSDYHPEDGSAPHPDDFIVTENDLETLQTMALKKLNLAAEDGSLLKCKDLVYLLYRWGELDGSGTQEQAKTWCATQMHDNDAVEVLAGAFVSSSWSSGMSLSSSSPGDTISVRNDYVSKEDLARFLDPDDFKARVKALHDRSPDGSSRQLSLKRFLEAAEREAR